MLLAVLIFAATLVLVIWQPKGLGIGWSASAGAVVALATGVVTFSDVPEVFGIIWNATLAFVAVIIISLTLDEAGFFEWAALHVARWGGGDGRKLFALIVLLGAAIAALFANDGAALILAPIVMAMLLALGFGAASTLAFVMATGFIADTASLPFVVSNLVNIVSADFFDIGFAEYARVMVPVNLVSVVASLAVLFVFYRRDIPSTYDLEELKSPREAVKDPVTFKTGWWILAFLLIGYFAADPIGVPVSIVAGLGAITLLAVSRRQRIIDTGQVMRGAPWQIVVFSLGMYLVVFGLNNAGLTDYLTRLLEGFAGYGVAAASVGTGVTTAVLSAIMNNMPTVMIGALSIESASTTGLAREAMIYANVIGADLGPKMTPIGSLATLLWLHVLQSKGTKITWGYYFKVGVQITVPVLLATLLALAGWLALVG
ncbi:arsenical efflux pump membrane protein ArsB [soil metagenome]